MYEYEFNDILDSGERILWSDKPHLMIHIMSGIPLFLFGLAWGAFDMFFIMGFRAFDGGIGFTGFFSIFMLIHMMPFWLGIGNMIRLIFVYRNTFMAYTDKRVITKTGFMGIDYKIKDFYNIENIEVNVNPIENFLGLGTIKIDEYIVNTGKNSSRRMGNRLYGIKNPYEVFKNLKEIVMDVKTDINYPNDYRPDINPGYNTKYSKR